MKLLFDLFPVILFFATFKYAQTTPETFANLFEKFLGSSIDITQAPILAATLIAIIASFLQVGYVFAKGKKPEVMLWISLAVIVVFGSLTIILHNELFIKWKPTILYWIFGTILTYGILTHRNFMEKLFQKQIVLPADSWQKVQIAWSAFFYTVGVINLAVAYLCTTETWVNFKLFGLLALTLVFTFGFAFWVSAQMQNNENTKEIRK